jgi:hypothetical protein
MFQVQSSIGIFHVQSPMDFDVRRDRRSAGCR